MDNRIGKREFAEPDWVNATISFTAEDLAMVKGPHQDPIFLTARVNNYDVARILVDTGSSVEDI